jgi:hypothetical protein
MGLIIEAPSNKVIRMKYSPLESEEISIKFTAKAGQIDHIRPKQIDHHFCWRSF